MRKNISPFFAIILMVSALLLSQAKVSNEDIEARSYKSIKAIHKHLDDDQDGDVNLQESTGFMVDELHLDDERRHSRFHRNDSLISVDDLWQSWKNSEVHNWTNEQVINWVSTIVGLPQYKDEFLQLRIDGRMLPRFTNESSSLYSDLGITNLKHRKKIYLRATDIVLFGPPRRGHTKDVILGVVVILMTLACLYALSVRKFAKKQIEQMMKDVEFMQQAEENLKDTQKKLTKAEMEHLSTVQSKREIEEKLRGEIISAKKEAERLHEERSHHQEERIKLSLVEQELTEVRRALQKAEAEMDSMAPRSPRSLQQWLNITYRKESKYFIMKKNNALKQMEDAKEACEKIRKKRGSIFGPLRLVHGQTIDEVDQKILSARSALAEVTNDLKERQHRWRQIEELCGFQIVNDGLLGQSLEIEDQSRRSSIARALAVCANLGGIGSLTNAVQRPVTLREDSPEPLKSQSRSVTKSIRSDQDFTALNRHSSLASDCTSTNGRNSPADVLSARESPYQSYLMMKSSLCSDNDIPSTSYRSIEGSSGIPMSDGASDIQSCVQLKSDESIGCQSGETNDNVNGIHSEAVNHQTFHVSRSTPTFEAIRHSPVRSSSVYSPNHHSMTSSSDHSSQSEEDNQTCGRPTASQNGESECNTSRILSLDESLLAESKKKQFRSVNDVNGCIGSVEDLLDRNEDSKKKTSKSSLKWRKIQSDDQISVKSESVVSKKRSLFSKLRKKQ